MANEQSWMDSATTVDQDTIEVTGPEYPYIQWVNGQKAMKKAGGIIFTGGWFMPEGQVSEALGGWEADTLEHKSGKSTEGYFSRDITVSVIRMRRRWTVYGGMDRSSYAWNDYDAAKQAGAQSGSRPSGHLQVLCVIQGLEEFGPLVLTMKGTICRAFMGGRTTGVLSEFNKLVVREANTINAKRGVAAKFPYRAFWLTVGPKRDDKGMPVFDEVGQAPNSSMVTVPVALGLGDKVEPGDLAKLFVGIDALTEFNEKYNDADEWAAAWDTTVVAESEPDNGDMQDIDPNDPDLPF